MEEFKIKVGPYSSRREVENGISDYVSLFAKPNDGWVLTEVVMNKSSDIYMESPDIYMATITLVKDSESKGLFFNDVQQPRYTDLTGEAPEFLSSDN